MNDRELLELIASQVGTLTNEVADVKSKMDEGFKEVNTRLDRIEDRVTFIEQDHGKKLNLLFDGYKQNADKLERIEKEVSKHEEVILRRVK